MTDEASEARQLLAPLRDRLVSVDSERLTARRARVVSSIELEVSKLGALRAKRARKRAAIGALSLAAAAALAFGGVRFAARHAVPAEMQLTFVGSVGQTIAQGAQSGERARPLHAGEALAVDPGEIQTAPAGSAELVSSAGLGLRLGGATHVALGGLLGPDATQRVGLQQGLLTCSVPHLQEGQRFSVQTPDARVVVHGTVFSVHVDLAQAPGQQTCVEVTDGVVIVQHAGAETALNAGDRWGCEAKAPSAVATLPPSEGNHEVDAPPAASSALGKQSPHITEHSTLAEERRLFQHALAADQHGQHDQAQSLLNQLLSKYPSSPLAPEARRALTRIASAPVQP